ncbi:MAG: shikimate kinase [Planctomycetota bacterium]
MHHIYLTGYRGTGKTSTGRLLARQLARPLIDLDARIEADSRRSIAEIFERDGEESFRDLESDALAAVASQAEPAVVALGGGAILRPQNRERIASSGTCVWLDADPEVIARRLAADQVDAVTQRPALTALGVVGEIRKVMASRRSLYADAADIHIDTSAGTLADLVERIVDALGLEGG